MAGRAVEDQRSEGEMMSNEKLALEKICESWDGCMFDAPGEMVDIGADLRRQFAAIVAQPAEQAGAGSILDDSDFLELLCKFHHESSCEEFDQAEYTATRNKLITCIDSRPRQVVQRSPDTEQELPPLPTACGILTPQRTVVYNAGQMHDYALAALAQQAPATVRDAERFRLAIALDDNAEMLYSVVMSNSPDVDAIRANFDAYVGGTPK